MLFPSYKLAGFQKARLRPIVTVAGGPEERPRRQHREVARVAVAVVAVVSMLLALLGTVVATAPAPADAATTGGTCSFANAGSGTYARTLCWFDMSGYNATTAGSAAGQAMTISLPGGYSISFTLKVSGGPVKAVAFPTYGGAYLGNGAYTGVGWQAGALSDPKRHHDHRRSERHLGGRLPGEPGDAATRSSAPTPSPPTPASRSPGPPTRCSA